MNKYYWNQCKRKNENIAIGVGKMLTVDEGFKANILHTGNNNKKHNSVNTIIFLNILIKAIFICESVLCRFQCNIKWIGNDTDVWPTRELRIFNCIKQSMICLYQKQARLSIYDKCCMTFNWQIMVFQTYAIVGKHNSFRMLLVCEFKGKRNKRYLFLRVNKN